MKAISLSSLMLCGVAAPALAEGHVGVLLNMETSDAHIRASEYIGARVYRADGSVKEATANQRTDWDDIGEVNELVLSPEGDVLAVIVGVGGFLGIGEKDVAMDMRQIKIIQDGDDADDYFLAVATTAADLKAARSYRERAAFKAPNVGRDGYVAVTNGGLTASSLKGARVYGVRDEDIGEVHSILLDTGGAIQSMVIDVGGFLGIGENRSPSHSRN